MGFDQNQSYSDSVPRSGRIKVSPTLRHFAAYSGPETLRFGFNAVIPDTDLHYTWLPVWKQLIKRNAVGSVMSAISGVNGAPMAAQKSLLTGVLRGDFDYKGYVISDW
jgi:beta-glucosidase